MGINERQIKEAIHLGVRIGQRDEVLRMVCNELKIEWIGEKNA